MQSYSSALLGLQFQISYIKYHIYTQMYLHIVQTYLW